MLIDTGSQLSVLSAEWVKKNKKYFKNTAMLPINNMNITTATKKKERVKQQAYVTLAHKNLEVTYPIIILNKLIYDGIIGIDLLKLLNAKIDINSNKIVCNYMDVQHELDLNRTEEECEVGKMPISISKPLLRCDPTHPVHTADEGMTTQEEKQLHEVIEEFCEIFSEVPTQTTVYEHSIIVSDSTKFVRRTYPIPMKYEVEVELEIRRMIENGVIERSNSNFLNPLVVVKKKSGDIRLCLDMRELNNIVLKEYDCAPTADELFAKCEGCLLYTSMY